MVAIQRVANEYFLLLWRIPQFPADGAWQPNSMLPETRATYPSQLSLLFIINKKNLDQIFKKIFKMNEVFYNITIF